MGYQAADHSPRTRIEHANTYVPYTESQQELIIFKACKNTTRGNGLALTREAAESL